VRVLSLLYLIALTSFAQPVKEVPSALGIRPGMTVAQVGLLGGSIDWTALSDAVGPNGRVDVVYFNRDLFDAPHSDRRNIRFVEGSLDDPKLAVASADVILIHDFSSRHQRSEKLLAFVRSALKPGGSFFISETFKWWDEDAYEKQIEASGFDILHRFEAGGFQWMAFRRP
jgi:predicted methyltransferase